jgi:hypothetical protein
MRVGVQGLPASLVCSLYEDTFVPLARLAAAISDPNRASLPTHVRATQQSLLTPGRTA